MKNILLVLFTVIMTNTAWSQVNLTCDFTKADNQCNPVHNFWSVRNRPSDGESLPVNNFREGSNINCVRMLGGWPVKNGSREFIESKDPYRWDGTKYIYDWVPLKERIEKVRSGNMELYQFVIDNVPWAFTRGIKFVEEQDNVHHTARDQEVRYGNGLPPNDYVEWSKFITAMMKELVTSYGDTVVAKWLFRIATEADNNPNHWAGTKQEFYDYYKITYDAIHSVLPGVKIGTQFLGQTHTFKSDWVDYKGNQIKTFGSDFITWCKQNNVKYDFIGTSFYPHYVRPDHINTDSVYSQLIAPFKENPDWDPSAEFHIQEFSLRSQPGLIHNLYSHAASHFAMMAKFVYERDIQQIYIWEINSLTLFAPEVLTMQALKTMLGKTRFAYSKNGSPQNTGNMIDAVFAKDENNQQFDALVYNYNISPEYVDDEKVELELAIPLPAKTKYQYRSAFYGKEQCAFNRFVIDFPLAAVKVSDDGWVLDDKDIAGNPLNILNDEGLTVFKTEASKYEIYNTLQWTDWENGITLDAGKIGNSKIRLQASLPSFSFQKFEFRVIRKN